MYFPYWFICNVTNAFSVGQLNRRCRRKKAGKCILQQVSNYFWRWTCEDDRCERPDHQNASFFFVFAFQDKLHTLDDEGFCKHKLRNSPGFTAARRESQGSSIKGYLREVKCLWCLQQYDTGPRIAPRINLEWQSQCSSAADQRRRRISVI